MGSGEAKKFRAMYGSAGRHGDSFWKEEQDNIGMKLLKGMGWDAGQGLGKNGQGMATAVKQIRKQDNRGIGATAATRDETAAARCYTEGLRMAEDARDLFERLIADDPASPPVSPASTRSEAFSMKSPVKTAPAWKMGYTNTAHELKPKCRGGAV